jgi:predicted nucleotidyltransferase
MEELGMTQSELARKAGISRGRLVELLKRNTARIRLGTAKKLAAAASVQESDLEVSNPRAHYFGWVAQENGHLDLSGIGAVRFGDRIPLGLCYIPVSTKTLTEGNHSCEREQDSSIPSGTAGEQKGPYKSLGAAMANHDRFFLLGDPGSGKTTALRHAALTYAQGLQQDRDYPSEPLVPLLVHLPAWARILREDPFTGPLEVAVDLLPPSVRPQTLPWLQERAREGDILLLLDGLDEVGDPEDRCNLLERIRVFSREGYAKRIIVSSRSIRFEEPFLGADFEVLSIQPLKRPAMKGFLRDWTSFRHGHPSERRCEKCKEFLRKALDAVEDHPHILDLARNPMILTILLLLQEAGVSLPRRRWDLYRKVSETLLVSWEEKKGKESGLLAASSRTFLPEAREITWVLESIALEMLRNDLTLIPRWWLARHIEGFLRNELGWKSDHPAEGAEALISLFRERGSLLRERSPELFGFGHVVFQDYFAARAVVAEPDPIAALRPFFYHPRWAEVVRLAVSNFHRRSVPKALRSILDDPDPAGRFLQRGLMTVLSILADGAPVNDSSLFDQLVVEIEGLGETRWLGIPLEALDGLHDIRDGELREFANKSAKRMLDRARSELPLGDKLELYRLAADFDFLSPHPLSGRSAREEDDLQGASSPLEEREIEIDGTSVKIVLDKNPRASGLERAKDLLDLFRSPVSDLVRSACAGQLGKFVSKFPEILEGFLHELDGEENPDIRSRLVRGLQAVADHPDVLKKLIAVLETDPNDEVREQAGMALKKPAATDKNIRSKLVGLLSSDSSVPVREGCARGLAMAAKEDTMVQEMLTGILRNNKEDEGVRVACLWALEQVIPGLEDGMELLIGALAESQHSKVTRVAAQFVGVYASSGLVELEKLPLEKAEHVLMSLKEPCPHAWRALIGIVESRERWRLGIPVEARIGRALSDVKDRVRVAFIFGSAARSEQGRDSDIDLLVVGEAGLRDLAPALKQAEQELGRQVNVVAYTEEEVKNRMKERNPFIEEVWKGAKIFVLGRENELTAMA